MTTLSYGDQFICSRENEILEVRLRNGQYVYFKKSVPIKNKKEVSKLLKDLEYKGIHLGKDWFE